MIIRTIQKKNTSSGITHDLRKACIDGVELKEATGQQKRILMKKIRKKFGNGK